MREEVHDISSTGRHSKPFGWAFLGEHTTKVVPHKRIEIKAVSDFVINIALPRISLSFLVDHCNVVTESCHVIFDAPRIVVLHLEAVVILALGMMPLCN